MHSCEVESGEHGETDRSHDSHPDGHQSGLKKSIHSYKVKKKKKKALPPLVSTWHTLSIKIRQPLLLHLPFDQLYLPPQCRHISWMVPVDYTLKLDRQLTILGSILRVGGDVLCTLAQSLRGRCGARRR